MVFNVILKGYKHQLGPKYSIFGVRRPLHGQVSLPTSTLLKIYGGISRNKFGRCPNLRLSRLDISRYWMNGRKFLVGY